MEWNSKSLGSSLQHQFFYLLVRLRLLPLAKLVLKAVVFYYTLVPSVRRRCQPYLKRRFPDATGLGQWLHCYRLYLCFAEGLLARCVAGIQNRPPQMTASEVEDRLSQILADREHGVIVLTGHFGGWQMGLSFVESADRPVNIVQWLSPEDVDRHYFEHKSQQGRHRMHIINSQEAANAPLEIATALGRKEIVCICGDRVTDSDTHYLEADFMGGKIRIPLTAFLLASLCQVPLAVTFSIIENGIMKGVWSEEMRIPAGLRRTPTKFAPYVQHFADIMEKLVQQHPYHFFNFYDLWRSNDGSRMQG